MLRRCPILRNREPAMSESDSRLIGESVLDASSHFISNVETRREPGTLRRRSSKLLSLPAPLDSFRGMFFALTIAKQQLREARRENDSLKTRNARLADELANASLCGTDARRQARHDILTGLPNRLLLKERLQHEIALAVQRSCDCLKDRQEDP